MSGWIIIAIVAILVWGVLRYKSDARSAADYEAHRAAHEEAQARIAAEQERDELRERIQVLERIITDKETPDARERQRVADEIEALRDTEDKEETGQ